MYAQSLFANIAAQLNPLKLALLASFRSVKSCGVYGFQASGNSLWNLSLHCLHCLFYGDRKGSLIGRTMTLNHRAAQS
jgi:hypothetical protein